MEGGVEYYSNWNHTNRQNVNTFCIKVYNENHPQSRDIINKFLLRYSPTSFATSFVKKNKEKRSRGILSFCCLH